MASLKTQIDALNSQMATSGGLGVFDANGKKVGNVVGVQDSVPWVCLTAAGRQFVLQVSPDRLLTGGFLWYAGPNCSGATYIAYFRTLSPTAPTFSPLRQSRSRAAWYTPRMRTPRCRV